MAPKLKQIKTSFFVHEATYQMFRRDAADHVRSMTSHLREMLVAKYPPTANASLKKAFKSKGKESAR